MLTRKPYLERIADSQQLVEVRLRSRRFLLARLQELDRAVSGLLQVCLPLSRREPLAVKRLSQVASFLLQPSRSRGKLRFAGGDLSKLRL
jgi:hypothetical protein